MRSFSALCHQALILLGLLCVLVPLGPARADWKNEVIYFVMIDRFADGTRHNNAGTDPADPLAFHGGDLAGITARLDHLSDLGATALWITPVVEQAPPEDHKGADFHGHHGYWAEDFLKIEPRYGTEADLRELVEEAHKRGIKVLLDVVYNHVGRNARWVRERPEWLRLGQACGGTEETRCIAGLPDLRTEREDVRAYLFDAHMGLAERVGLDGFRLDTYKHIPDEFWTEHREAVHKRLGEEFFLLGEIWDGDKYMARRPFKADAVDGIFDFSFRDRTLKLLNGVDTPQRYSRYFRSRHKTADGHVLAPFLSSHDYPMLLASLGGDKDKYRIALALLMFAEGPPVLTWGEERGRMGGVWPGNREFMDWDGGDLDLQAYVTGLIKLRAERPAMRAGEVEVLHAQNKLLVLKRQDTILVVNLSNGRQEVSLPDETWRPLLANGAPDGAIGKMSAMFFGANL